MSARMNSLTKRYLIVCAAEGRNSQLLRHTLWDFSAITGDITFDDLTINQIRDYVTSVTIQAMHFNKGRKYISVRHEIVLKFVRWCILDQEATPPRQGERPPSSLHLSLN
jgi:hypothetical protein